MCGKKRVREAEETHSSGMKRGKSQYQGGKMHTSGLTTDKIK